MFSAFSILLSLALHNIRANESIACGKSAIENALNNKIAGGTDTIQRNWPWNVQLVQGRKNQYRVFCGGSVLSQEWVVTAAHCFFVNGSNKIRKEFFNELLIFGDLEVPKDSIVRKLSLQKHLIHKDYEGVGKNDIALIQLKRPITYSEFIRPICLPQFGYSFKGREAIITGWGSLSPDAKRKPTHLQAAQVEIFSAWNCFFKYLFGLCFSCLWDIVVEDTVCAGGSWGAADSCPGDSGSPMAVKEGGFWTLVGVVSGGADCGGSLSPALYTDVPKYTQWIRGMMRHS